MFDARVWVVTLQLPGSVTPESREEKRVVRAQRGLVAGVRLLLGPSTGGQLCSLRIRLDEMSNPLRDSPSGGFVLVVGVLLVLVVRRDGAGGGGDRQGRPTLINMQKTVIYIHRIYIYIRNLSCKDINSIRAF
ncbi:hypothetical protein Dimus_035476 [Dionaea muscipula]